MAYSEPFAIVFLIVALFRTIKHGEEAQNPVAIFMLLAAGLMIKESLLIPAGVLSAYIWLSSPASEKKDIAWLAYASIMLVPVGLYMAFRKVPYSLSGVAEDAMLSHEFWSTGFLAWFEQFGAYLIPWILIPVFMFRKKSGYVILLIPLIIAGYFAQSPLLKVLWGYSRYNLILWPVIVAAAAFMVGHPVKRGALLQIPVLLLALLVAVYLSPVSLSNGLRKPGWGDYHYITSEFDVPYDKAWKILAENKAQNVVFLGRSYHYFDAFYTFKYRLNTKVTNNYAGLDSLITGNADWLVIQEGPGSEPLNERQNKLKASFKHVQIVQKGSLRLHVYHRGDSL